ncbi:MAG: maleylpyruvate isomerase family mycothiol-dependent enzyme [Acidimicrobiia bacterium]
MDHGTYRAAIATEGGRLAALPGDALDRPVPSCPGWDLGELIGHVGRVHRWAAAHLAEAPGKPTAKRPAPPEGDAVLPWYQESLDLILTELDRHDPDEPAHSFAGPATVGFWARRQAHELAVHRWDAQNALSPGAAEPIPAPLAADGIDEWLELFVPRFLALRREPIPAELVGASLHLHGTDEDQTEPAEWLLRLTAEGCEVERAHAKGDAALRGPASDLLLAAWHRVPLDRVDVVGAAARAEAVLALVHVT